MHSLLDIDDLAASDIRAIWQSVGSRPERNLARNVAWSFEGNGIRTRTTFVQAFQRLGLNYVELPNFLKTGELTQDLAGYMDPFFDLYVIRERDHGRLSDFAQATIKPVINAMSAEAHPCEVLTDAYFLNAQVRPINQLAILLWGPMTNVFKSWYSLSQVLGLNLTHFSPEHTQVDGPFDVVITDGWPSGFSDPAFTLTPSMLSQMGNPILIPTPPVTVGNEISHPLEAFPQFVGYEQKALLLPVQVAIISHMLKSKAKSQ